MTRQRTQPEDQIAEYGEVVVYQSADGASVIDVHLREGTVWLSQAQLATLFQRDQSVVSRHLNNVFKEGELPKVGNMQKMHIAQSDKPVVFYNLDVIISVGYRVKSHCGTQFRIWATGVLKDHLVRGYSLNRRRLAEKGAGEIRQVLELLASTLEGPALVSNEGRAVLEIVNRYARAWQLLLEYDEDRLLLPADRHGIKAGLEINEAQAAIGVLKQELHDRGEATDLFGAERGHGLAGIIGALHQTFDGEELYPSVEEKAAHLLYFVIKDHPFADGNKRIGSFLFLYYLELNGQLAERHFDNKALVALALLAAASDPRQKEILIRLIVNLIAERG